MSDIFKDLQVGQTVKFSKPPLGSYIKANEEYLVEWKDKGSAYFRSVVRGSGTYDKAWAINMAVIAA